jgi:phosphomannomutase/phosphoglucomutase
VPTSVPNPSTRFSIDAGLFKAYDIRGVVGRSLTSEAARAIGAALGSEALAQAKPGAHPEIAVGRDGRLSGPMLRDALIEGIRSTGVNVVDIGQVATPMLYFAAVHLGIGSGVEITGSHNPPEYNGLKMVLGGEALYGEGLQRLYRRIVGTDASSGGLVRAANPGALRAVDVRQAYLDRIVGDVRLARPLRVVVDCGNGVAGSIAGDLYRALGCTVTELFCEVDGNFPNHHPDPAHPENLQDLIEAVRRTGAELGLAFDGDGDRLGVVTRSGKIIYPDRQIMLFARDILAARPGAEIVFDVKCTRHIAPWVRQHGGRPTMWRTGHSLIKARLRESGAAFAGEMSGHLFFNDRWYGFDDGLYAGARLLEILSRESDPSATLESLPDATSTPELHLQTAEGENVRLVERLRELTQPASSGTTGGKPGARAAFAGAREFITIDGIRVEYEDGFGLARPSNTTPVVVMRFEADNAAALARIQAEFRQAIALVAPGVVLPF